MSRVNLVLVWHMHQPQYRDPSTGRYMLPWTRLHALKDYWGMVKVLGEFPGVHATFNFVPLLAAQIEEYASGKFREPWFEMAFAPADSLKTEQKREILERAFQVNEIYVHRWPRFAELQAQVRSGGAEACVADFNERDWRDLQLLSQLVWMDEEYIAKDPVVNVLAAKGKDFTERDKDMLKEKQLELLGAVLPEYRIAAESGQIEISTTPYYHPILPLLCDTDIARVSNPHTPLPQPPFRYPEDAREQLLRARNLPRTSVWQASGRIMAVGRIGFRSGRSRSRWNWDSSGSRRMRASLAAREISGSGGMPEDILKMARIFILPGDCSKRRKGNLRIFPRSLYIGPDGIRLQPHGRGGRGGGFASQNPRDR